MRQPGQLLYELPGARRIIPYARQNHECHNVTTKTPPCLAGQHALRPRPVWRGSMHAGSSYEHRAIPTLHERGCVSLRICIPVLHAWRDP